MVTRMRMDILFDREIEREKHYISPGGYEIANINGDVLQFDFEDFVGNIDRGNKKVLHVEQRNLDLAAFPEAMRLEQFLCNFGYLSDLYVYTGEHDEPEINPVKAYNIVFSENHGDEWIISGEYVFTEK